MGFSKFTASIFNSKKSQNNENLIETENRAVNMDKLKILFEAEKFAEAEKAAENLLNLFPESKTGIKIWKKARKQQGKSIDVDMAADGKKEIFKTYYRYDSCYSTDKINRALGSDHLPFRQGITLYDSNLSPRDRVISEYNLKHFEFDLILSEGKRASWPVKDESSTDAGSRIAYRDSLNCQYCYKSNIAAFWPEGGDFKPFYCQDEEITKEKPGAFRLPVQCPHCQKTWYVIWDDDPEPLARMFLDHIERMCEQHKDFNCAHKIWRSMITDKIMRKNLRFLEKEGKRAADQKMMIDSSFMADDFFNIITIVPAVELSGIQSYLGSSYLQYLQNHYLTRWDKPAYHLTNWIFCFDEENTLLNMQFFPRDEDVKKAPTIYPTDLLTSDVMRLIESGGVQ